MVPVFDAVRTFRCVLLRGDEATARHVLAAGEEVGLGARLRSASFGKHGGSFLVSAEASIDAQSEAPEIAVVNAPYRATSPQPGF